MKFEIPIHQKYLDMIKSGEKTIEIRLYSKKYAELKKDKCIYFNGTCRKKIKKIAQYKSFEELCANENVSKMGFQSPEQAIKALKGIYWYPLDNKTILAIHLI